MGTKKVNLLRADEYAALVAVQKMADLVVAAVRDAPGPVEIRVEDARFKLWDDMTVLSRAADGTERLEAWQVKRQTGKLTRQQMVALLEALAEQPEIHCARLAVKSMVEVAGVGSLAALEALSTRFDAPSLDLSLLADTLSRDQRAWFDLAAKIGGSDEVGLSILSRLRVEARGSDSVVREHIADKLLAVTDDPEALRDRIRAWGRDSLDPAGRITWAGLSAEIRGLLDLDQQGTGQATQQAGAPTGGQWVRVPTFSQAASIARAIASGDKDTVDSTVRDLVWLNQACLLQATAEALSESGATELVVLFNLVLDVEEQTIVTSVLSHRTSLLRFLRLQFEGYKRDPRAFRARWDDFRAEWSFGNTGLPLAVNDDRFAPLQIAYDRGLRFIDLTFDVTFRHSTPETTDDFLRLIGSMIQAPAVQADLGPPGHPVNKLFAHHTDSSRVDLGLLRFWSNDPNRFDYLYGS